MNPHYYKKNVNSTLPPQMLGAAAASLTVVAQNQNNAGGCVHFFLVVRVHESRSTSSEGDPQLGKFVLSRQVNLNTPGLSKALLAICFMSVLSVCEPSIEGKISKILIEFCIS